MRRKRLRMFLATGAILAAIALGCYGYHAFWGGYRGAKPADFAAQGNPDQRQPDPEATARQVRSAIAAAEEAVRNTDRPGWIAEALAAVETGLDLCPPGEANWSSRRRLLLLSDVPVNARHSDAWKQAVGAYHQRRTAKALNEITAARVDRGVRIWRLYNMGFVVKSADAAVGLDIHPGWVFDGAMTKAQQQQLAGLLDVAFVSHNHPDHLSREFLAEMRAAGKTVVLPERVAKDIKGEGVERLWDTHGQPAKVGGVEVYAYPGRHYGDVLVRVCVYVVRIGGCLVMHQGDNTKGSVYDDIAAAHHVDVLLGNCWAQLGECVTGVKPGLLITGHENEIKHPKGMRSGFALTFEELDKLALASPWGADETQVTILNWGEHTRFSPPDR